MSNICPLLTSSNRSQLDTQLQTRATEYQYVHKCKQVSSNDLYRRANQAQKSLENKRLLLHHLCLITEQELRVKKKGGKPKKYLLERSRAVARCGRTMRLKVCGKKHTYIEQQESCNWRGCPHCARRLSRKRFKKSLPILVHYGRMHSDRSWYMLTLTQPQQKETAEESQARLMKSMRKFRSTVIWKRYIHGGEGSIELLFKIKQSRWHTHAHLFVSIKGTSQNPLSRSELKEFKAVWKRVTGGATNLHIRKIDDVERGIKEVFKYITKPIDYRTWTTKQFREILLMKGKRMTFKFGDLYNYKSEYEITDADLYPIEEEYGLLSDDELRRHWANVEHGDICPEPDCGSYVDVGYVREKELPDLLRRLAMSPTEELRE